MSNTTDGVRPTGAGAAPGATKRDYLPAERQDMILSLLTRQNVATVQELAALLNTSDITIRRDLTTLADAGLLRRIRGGAMSVRDAQPAQRGGRTAASAGTAGTAASAATGGSVSHGGGHGMSAAASTAHAGGTTHDDYVDDPFAPNGTDGPISVIGEYGPGQLGAAADIGAGSFAAHDGIAANARLPHVGTGLPYGLGTRGRSGDDATDALAALAGRSIGVMLPEPSFFWPSVIEQMRTLAAHAQITLNVRESSYNGDIHEERILDEFAADPNMCGLVVAPTSEPTVSQRTWDWISTSPLPVTVVERDQPVIGDYYVDSVRTNHPYGVRKAATHFIQHGHTNIAAAFTNTPTSDVILAGWLQVVHDVPDINGTLVFDGVQPYDAPGVEEIVERILGSSTTAVLVHSDYLAIALAQALEKAGKRVPEDISMISIDGYATLSSRPLTVLRSSPRDLAEAALRTLVERILNPERATRHVFVDPQLIDRGSVVDRA
ncbi:substrate-binding domain-containing protein [Bifidobacterium amazonense]|uniref:Substrate-binding domain-containing protein n=1 Tax=Bifidobacterium amazonense TaxID=2809027 RepID=A0ABS9VS68_9BIFI|nr:substrate-binding domain-containing protein [Bifidobacterium amazonense]MCH9274835.1 substrate-binding domain-containing protein [Bifidobacterium amazonense]